MYFSPFYPGFAFEFDAKMESCLKCNFLDSFIPSSTHLINIYRAPGTYQELEILTVSKADKILSLPHRAYSLRVFLFFFFFDIKLEMQSNLRRANITEGLKCELLSPVAVSLNFDILISSFVTLGK